MFFFFPVFFVSFAGANVGTENWRTLSVHVVDLKSHAVFASAHFVEVFGSFAWNDLNLRITSLNRKPYSQSHMEHHDNRNSERKLWKWEEKSYRHGHSFTVGMGSSPGKKACYENEDSCCNERSEDGYIIPCEFQEFALQSVACQEEAGHGNELEVRSSYDEEGRDSRDRVASARSLAHLKINE